VFGIWMSVEPAVAALIGLALLGQHLSIAEWAAVGCVVAASIGAARAAPAPSDALTPSGAPALSDAPAPSGAPAPLADAPAVPAPPTD
jgi:inner membrane transporter RhtA